MDEKTLRKEFERWCGSEGMPTDQWAPGIYAFLSTEAAWQAWLEATRRADRRARTDGGMMDEEFNATIDEWESHDDWKYADREAERLFFFKAAWDVSARRADRKAREECAEICEEDLNLFCAVKIRATIPEEE